MQIQDTFTVGTQPIRMICGNDSIYVLNSDSTINIVTTQGVQDKITLSQDNYTDLTLDSTYIWVCASSGNVLAYPLDQNPQNISGFPSGIICNSILSIGNTIVVVDNNNNVLNIFSKNGNIKSSTKL